MEADSPNHCDVPTTLFRKEIRSLPASPPGIRMELQLLSKTCFQPLLTRNSHGVSRYRMIHLKLLCKGSFFPPKHHSLLMAFECSDTTPGISTCHKSMLRNIVEAQTETQHPIYKMPASMLRFSRSEPFSCRSSHCSVSRVGSVCPQQHNNHYSLASSCLSSSTAFHTCSFLFSTAADLLQHLEQIYLASPSKENTNTWLITGAGEGL